MNFSVKKQRKIRKHGCGQEAKTCLLMSGKKHCRKSGYQKELQIQKELKELVYQFRKIGTNINQATKQLHIGYEPAAAADRLEKNMKLLEQQFEKMKEELKQTYGNHEDIKH